MSLFIRFAATLSCAAMLMTVGLGSAVAEPVYLTCKDNLSQVSLTIDYKASTVTSTNLANGQPMKDVRGNAVHPAKVSSSQIIWTVKASTGQFTYTLSRLTAQLQWRVSDPNVPGTDDGGVMSCDVGAKPAPKF